MNGTRSSRTIAAVGAIAYVGMMATGYYYNLTFIQLGVVEWSDRVLGLARGQVAAYMGGLALMTLIIALVTGDVLTRNSQRISLAYKLRLAFAVVAVQSILTAILPWVRSPISFGVWIVATSTALGAGVPAMFSLMVDLVPVRWRGLAAGCITAAAYLVANIAPGVWTMETFRAQLLWIMPPGALLLGVIAFMPLPPIDTLARQHGQAAFAHGRFAPADGRSAFYTRSFWVLVGAMFTVFFIDSLGFLRLVDTPRYMANAWQSADPGIRLFIGGVHVVTALAGGVLYSALDARRLLFWIFGIFALTHLMYIFHTRLTPLNGPALALPMLYATGVSVYTVLNFAVWADLSTPSDAARISAVGVAFSGWAATFLSTGLAIWWQQRGVSLQDHLNRVDAIAMLAFALIWIAVYFGVGIRLERA